MNFINHNFHKESYPELRHFLKVAEKADKNKKNVKQKHILEKYLPKNEGLQNLLKTLQENETEECDHISIRDEESPVGELNKIEIDADLEDVLNEYVNNINEELADVILEVLNSGEAVPDDLLKRLCIECSETQISEIFTTLSEELNTDSICNFGDVLCNYNYCSANLLVLCYFKSLLVPKLCSEQTKNLENVFEGFYSKYSTIIQGELLKTMLYAENISTLMENVNKLGHEEKNALLYDITMGMTKIEQRHMKIIDHLLNPNINFEVKKKIVELMHSSIEEFSTDKVYGKLLVTVLQSLGRHLQQVETLIKHIIERHRSVWKIKAGKLFETVNESNLLSQSVRY